VPRRLPVLLVALVVGAGLVACGGDDEVSIDSGAPQILPTTTSTTSTTQPDDDDERDHGKRSKEKVSCDDEPEPHISGVIGDVEITDFCDKVTITGVGLDVTIEGTTELVVRGSNHRIVVSDEVSRVHLEGSGHEVQVPDPDNTEIDDESFNSEVHG
jgi:hypothetical protein